MLWSEVCNQRMKPYSLWCTEKVVHKPLSFSSSLSSVVSNVRREWDLSKLYALRTSEHGTNLVKRQWCFAHLLLLEKKLNSACYNHNHKWEIEGRYGRNFEVRKRKGKNISGIENLASSNSIRSIITSTTSTLSLPTKNIKTVASIHQHTHLPAKQKSPPLIVASFWREREKQKKVTGQHQSQIVEI